MSEVTTVPHRHRLIRQAGELRGDLPGDYVPSFPPRVSKLPLPAIDRAAAACAASPTGAHAWKIASPAGATSAGVCRHCARTREFVNAADASVWDSADDWRRRDTG
jgi:hypothetical protein